MSGGFFDYKQSQFMLLADEIESLLNKKDEFPYTFGQSSELEPALQKTKALCEWLYDYVKNIDYYIEGDTGAKTFDKTKKELDVKLLKILDGFTKKEVY